MRVRSADRRARKGVRERRQERGSRGGGGRAEILVVVGGRVAVGGGVLVVHLEQGEAGHLQGCDGVLGGAVLGGRAQRFWKKGERKGN